MSKRGPDFQKREAKRSLWEQDGTRVHKKYRNKSKGRQKDNKLTNPVDDTEAFLDFLLNEESSEALDCYYYGPCQKCLNES